VEAQGNLFEKKTINEKEDSFKEFLKMLFRTCELIYSSRIVYEAYTEWGIEKDIQKEMERDAEIEIEEEDDF
jgi:nucleoside-specific outer membrane channel protein Tsx